MTDPGRGTPDLHAPGPVTRKEKEDRARRRRRVPVSVAYFLCIISHLRFRVTLSSGPMKPASVSGT
jgi:hypothetical protein